MAGGKRVLDPETLAGLLLAAAFLIWLFGFAWSNSTLPPPWNATTGLYLTGGMVVACLAGYLAGRTSRL